MKRPHPLPPELRRLCAVAAHERLRREARALAAALRRTMAERLADGESIDALTAEMRAAVARAREPVVCAAGRTREDAPR